jgi:uncharacterized integral membrane protein
MRTSEQRAANLWAVIVGGTVLMLLVIVLDLYAVELLEIVGRQAFPGGLLQFRLLLFGSVLLVAFAPLVFRFFRRLFRVFKPY